MSPGRASANVRGGDRVVPLAAELELEPGARDDPRRLEVLAREVEGDVAEPVDVERRRADLPRARLRLRQIEPDERVRVDRRAELLDRDARGEVRRGGREDIAAVEGPRDRSSAYAGFASSCAASIPARSAAGTSRPLSGPTKKRPSPSRSASAPAGAADAGVDDREMDADRHVRQRAREHERALQDRLRAGSRA